MTEKVYRKRYLAYRALIERRIRARTGNRLPDSLQIPIRYVLGSGGKRVRALLVLLACEAVGGTSRQALDAAVGIELLHNFTLVHDDVMDHAGLRRSVMTVHKKWGENAAILAGDEMIALAYESILATRSGRIREIMDTVTDAFRTVCEGQAFDKEFESRRDVSLAEYRSMIGKKTARMISASTEIGAMIGGGDRREVLGAKLYGHNLGMAFQLKDDLLDITGDAEDFGKAIGGDVQEGKKTFLLLRGIERTRGRDRSFLASLAPGRKVTRDTINRVHGIYERSGTLADARKAIARFTRASQRSLGSLVPSPSRDMMDRLADQLLHRTA